MSDKELEEYINKIEPNFDIHIEKGTIEMSNEYYNLLEEKMVRIINKNQSLKKENKILRENAEHNDKVVDKTNWENLKLKEENKRLYKTIEELSQYDREEDMMNKEDYGKYYIQGSDHYLIPKDVFDELFDEMENWRDDTKELKKQLEEANEKILLLQASEPMLEYKKALEENQQKEFINYLENEKNIYPYDISDYTYEDIINTVLSKYYEIIEK